MSAFRSVLLLFFCLVFTSIPGKVNAKSDSGFVRHRISILPTQIYLREYSLFYEIQPSPKCAFEVSAGYQTLYDEWTYRPNWDFEFDKGIVARASFKYFPAGNRRSLYLAPMFLFKTLSEENRSIGHDSQRNTEAEFVKATSRLVTGGYGLFGFRTWRTIYFDFYFGIGKRYYRDIETQRTIINSEIVKESVRRVKAYPPDMKLGVKLGITLR